MARKREYGRENATAGFLEERRAREFATEMVNYAVVNLYTMGVITPVRIPWH